MPTYPFIHGKYKEILESARRVFGSFVFNVIFIAKAMVNCGIASGEHPRKSADIKTRLALCQQAITMVNRLLPELLKLEFMQSSTNQVHREQRSGLSTYGVRLLQLRQEHLKNFSKAVPDRPTSEQQGNTAELQACFAEVCEMRRQPSPAASGGAEPDVQPPGEMAWAFSGAGLSVSPAADVVVPRFGAWDGPAFEVISRESAQRDEVFSPFMVQAYEALINEVGPSFRVTDTAGNFRLVPNTFSIERFAQTCARADGRCHRVHGVFFIRRRRN